MEYTEKRACYVAKFILRCINSSDDPDYYKLLIEFGVAPARYVALYEKTPKNNNAGLELTRSKPQVIISPVSSGPLSQKLVLLRIARCYAERKSKLTSARTFSCITITGRGYKNLYVSSYFATVICSQGRKAHEIDGNSEYQSF